MRKFPRVEASSSGLSFSTLCAAPNHLPGWTSCDSILRFRSSVGRRFVDADSVLSWILNRLLGDDHINLPRCPRCLRCKWRAVSNLAATWMVIPIDSWLSELDSTSQIIRDGRSIELHNTGCVGREPATVCSNDIRMRLYRDYIIYV